MPRGARPGNLNAGKHLARSAPAEGPIGAEAARQRKRLLRRIGTQASALDPASRLYVDVIARAAAKVEYIDEYLLSHPMIREGGEVEPVMKLYVSLLNTV